MNPSVCLCLSVRRSVCLSVCLSACPPVWLAAWLSGWLYVCIVCIGRQTGRLHACMHVRTSCCCVYIYIYICMHARCTHMFMYSFYLSEPIFSCVCVHPDSKLRVLAMTCGFQSVSSARDFNLFRKAGGSRESTVRRRLWILRESDGTPICVPAGHLGNFFTIVVEFWRVRA